MSLSNDIRTGISKGFETVIVIFYYSCYVELVLIGAIFVLQTLIIVLYVLWLYTGVVDVEMLQNISDSLSISIDLVDNIVKSIIIIVLFRRWKYSKVGGSNDSKDVSNNLC